MKTSITKLVYIILLLAISISYCQNEKFIKFEINNVHSSDYALFLYCTLLDSNGIPSSKGHHYEIADVKSNIGETIIPLKGDYSEMIINDSLLVRYRYLIFYNNNDDVRGCNQPLYKIIKVDASKDTMAIEIECDNIEINFDEVK